MGDELGISVHGDGNAGDNLDDSVLCVLNDLSELSVGSISNILVLFKLNNLICCAGYLMNKSDKVKIIATKEKVIEGRERMRDRKKRPNE